MDISEHSQTESSNDSTKDESTKMAVIAWTDSQEIISES